MIKIDVYDKKILEILINNSRKQVTTIAKKVRLKRETVTYKINRLIKEDLIKEFNAVLNEKKFGLSHYAVFLELANLQEETEREILKNLKENKNLCWIGTSAGKWSLTFDLIIKEDKELNNTMDELLTKFRKNIGDFVILRLQEGNYFSSKLIGMNKKIKIEEIKEEKAKIDEIDKKILSIINRNSRVSLVEISEKVKLTPNGINNRIKALEKNKIILSYTISLDWKKLGYEWYGIQLQLTKFGEEINKKLIEYFTNHKSIIFYYKYLGGAWDYDFGVLVKNSIELREFIHEFRKNFSDCSKISDVFITLEETSGYKLPRGVFE